MADEVKLFRTWSSPYGLRAVWALKLKGIEFETIFEDLANKSPLLLQYNPVHKKIPVLVHNGNPVCESLVILEYIDETWNEAHPLLPKDPFKKAQARFWAKFNDEKTTGGGQGIEFLNFQNLLHENNMADEVKLFRTWSSRYSLRVVWALKLKGIEFENIFEDLANKSPLLLQYNPVHKKVPVLVHNGKPVCESLVILEYIDETWNEAHPLLPKDPFKKAQARFWAKFNDEKLLPSITKASLGLGKEKEEARILTTEYLKNVEEQLEGKKFFGGEKIGYLDLVFGWMAYLINVLEEVAGTTLINKESCPLLSQWMKNFYEIPVFKDSWPDRDKLITRNSSK